MCCEERQLVGKESRATRWVCGERCVRAAEMRSVQLEEEPSQSEVRLAGEDEVDAKIKAS